MPGQCVVLGMLGMHLGQAIKPVMSERAGDKWAVHVVRDNTLHEGLSLYSHHSTGHSQR